MNRMRQTRLCLFVDIYVYVSLSLWGLMLEGCFFSRVSRPIGQHHTV